jgi:hypothetical protein
MSNELPWSKREIIDAMIAAYKPIDPKNPVFVIHTMTVCTGIWKKLALSRAEGRAAPHIELALAERIARVYKALHEGRDPNAAYDVPLDLETDPPRHAPHGQTEAAAATNASVRRRNTWSN